MLICALSLTMLGRLVTAGKAQVLLITNAASIPLKCLNKPCCEPDLLKWNTAIINVIVHAWPFPALICLVLKQLDQNGSVN